MTVMKRRTIGLLVVGMGWGAVSVVQAEKPLTIDYPTALFVGTPPPAMKLPNLEPPGKPNQPPPSYTVPAGTVLLSSEKVVTSSDEYPILGDLEMLTDGDKEGTDGSYTELGSGLQWVQVDLEEVVRISAVAVWHWHSTPRAYLDMVVQASNDPDFIEGVTTLYNNDHDNSAGFGVGGDKTYIETNHGRVIISKGVKARYVRAYSKGNTEGKMNHYIEVEVYGIPDA